jgi:hypothetical protein
MSNPKRAHIGVRCPDCPGALNAERHLKHAATCPLATAVDERTAADAAWFRAHPGEPELLRPAVPAEVQEWQLFGVLPPGPVPAHMTVLMQVSQVKPGLRLRCPIIVSTAGIAAGGRP